MRITFIFPCAALFSSLAQLGQQIIRRLHSAEQPADDGKATGAGAGCVSVLETGELPRELMRLVLMAAFQFNDRAGQTRIMSKAHNQRGRAGVCQM